jgi:hypothetical protein
MLPELSTISALLFVFSLVLLLALCLIDETPASCSIDIEDEDPPEPPHG